MRPEFWANKRVLVTGHTGFKGAWLVLLLQELGASVTGIALPPDSNAGIYAAAGLASHVDSHYTDIRDADALTQLVTTVNPEIVLHLAAQPLVRASYREPAQTFQTNVLGTVNLLDALRQLNDLSTVLVVTTDKVYENKEDGRAFHETDRLGGLDPYSASKSCTELVVNAWRHSFFNGSDNTSAHLRRPVLVTARAGNVIGGGDTSAERLLPDVLAAFEQQQPVTIRQPHSVRPWQHVLEPLSGYLALIEHADNSRPDSTRLQPSLADATAVNFGPTESGHCTVAEVVAQAAQTWGEGAAFEVNQQGVGAFHEAGLLKLDCTLAAQMLGWRPIWSMEEAVARGVAWRRAQLAGECMHRWSVDEITAFRQATTRQTTGDTV